jgi:hypothetical protein
MSGRGARIQPGIRERKANKTVYLGSAATIGTRNDSRAVRPHKRRRTGKRRKSLSPDFRKLRAAAADYLRDAQTSPSANDSGSTVGGEEEGRS